MSAEVPVGRLRNGHRLLGFNSEHIVPLFLERIKLTYNVVYIYIGWPVAHREHTSNRIDLRQSRSTIVPVSSLAPDTSFGDLARRV